MEPGRGGAENREMKKKNNLKVSFFFFFSSWFSAFLSTDAQLDQCSWLPDKCGEISQFELVVSGAGTEGQIRGGGVGLLSVWELVFLGLPGNCWLMQCLLVRILLTPVYLLTML